MTVAIQFVCALTLVFAIGVLQFFLSDPSRSGTVQCQFRADAVLRVLL